MGNKTQTAVDPFLSIESVVAAKRDLLCCEVNQESIILDSRTGTYFGLNAVGSRIWARIQQPTTLAAMRDALVDEFDVETSECEYELLGFIRELAAKGLVEIHN